jgi:hypothetical protein
VILKDARKRIKDSKYIKNKSSIGICKVGIAISMYIEKIAIENTNININQFFKIGYCTDIKKYLLCVHIAWVAGYNRYYEIDEGDLVLYEINQEKFCKKYEKEINTYRTGRLIGSGALRDYDFKSLPDEIIKSLRKYPSFSGYYYKDGILYARIKIGDTIFRIPPVQDGKQM